MELSLIHPFILLVTRMEAGNGWRPTPAVTSSHFSQINGQRTLVNGWSVKSMSGQTLLYSRIGSAATNYRTSSRPKPRYQLSSCLPRPQNHHMLQTTPTKRITKLLICLHWSFLFFSISSHMPP
ncbi:hypothetical protein FOXYSP1_13481 [Fusarium oxysporum f. sp. phaseoli]